MSDQDIFNEDKEIKKDEIDLTKTDDIKKDDEVTADQLLNTIVNEDGTPKYKSQEEALIALNHAQKHIKTLEADNSVLKEQSNSAAKLDELLEAVKKSKESGQDNKEVSTIKPEDVLGIVKDYLNETKEVETRSSNIKTVTSVFKERFGDDASKKLYDTASDLGFNREEINSMIATNPKAALKVLGIDVKKDSKQDIITKPNSVDTAQFNRKPEGAPKSIMGVSSSKELIDAFEASKQKTLKRLGLSET